MESGTKKRMYITEDDNKRKEYKVMDQKSFNRMARKYNMPKYEKNYSF